MAAPKLTEAVIRAGATDKSFQRGRELYRSGAISNAWIQGQSLSGECEGNESPFYKVRVELDGGGIRTATCTCPYDFGGYCKHIIALLLAYAQRPKQFSVRREPAELLADLTREQLLALVTKLLREQPDLYEWVETALTLPASGKAKSKTAKRKQVDTAVYQRRVRGIMHSLDHMRMSEAYWHVGGLVGELNSVRQSAIQFLDAGDAESALQILLALIKESHDGFEYIDDSNGELGDFLSGVGETLAEVILSLDLNEDEREDLASDLDELHDQLSDYGIEGLSVAIAAAEYGWDESPREGSARRAGEETEDESEWDDDDEDELAFEADEFGQFGASWAHDDPAQALTHAKLNVLERQGRTREYLALCVKEGEHLRCALKLCELDRMPEAISYGLKHLTVADEALLLAQRLRESGQLDDSIKVGERGLKLAGRKASLGEWLGPVEEAQGRKGQALEAWLAAFSEKPSLSTYQTIKRLAGARWGRLKSEIMATLEKFYDKQPLAEVLLFEQEWDAAIKVADQKGAYHTVVGTVAEALIPHRPEWVVRASIKLAEDLIVQTKSNLYPAAADWLKRAKAAYAKLERTSEWQKYLQQLKEQYKRRPALQAQLARL
ncbi:MAG TPA: SWIM zinc finger family protein [Pyrinomonadaceae bacterium]|nr:SWIM zinc finger family protein [Pyrinomonadaceae bacterium]